MFSISLGDDGALLCPLEPRHADELLAHIDRGRDHIGRYTPLPDVVVDAPSARAYLQAYADKRAADGGEIFGIRSGGVLVGGVMFRLFDAATGNCEIGCWLEPGAAGRGLVTRAVRLLIDWAFAERGMHRVEWIAASGNEASVATARRLGMTRDGVLRQSGLHRGVRHDMEIWSVLAHEWDGASGTARVGREG
ncbi:GNAT family N-acetyltransferase [Streptomyces tsukubensis]|uniref:GNAT family N-acetyltransferase n=1 Tax=Streptomyces tsukubensis TaxID=83656 RepID=UPI001265E5E2|nr:GNAT family protein [Streptomyces tsukubensis]QFR95879.1 GNAT family N-acetyltransferase [Streptomyces tsukubensis]